MISAATGAIALVVAPLAREYGLQYLIAAVILGGVLQILLAVAGVARLMRFVPRSVMVGFVNALAILIFTAQFQYLIDVPWVVYPMVVIGVGIIFVMPRITTVIPGPLVAVVLVTLTVVVMNINVPRVGDQGELPDSLPILGIPSVPFTLDTFMIIAPFALAIALVGLMESLMTAKLVDDITDTRSNKTRESWGQGVANIVTGFFGGMGGCAMIGQSIINVNSGGRGRLSGAAAAIALLCFVLFGAPLIEQIPIAALVGVMFMVVIGTFAWSSFRILHKIPLADAIVLVTVSAVTVWQDLAIAVIVGVIMSALVFAWKNATMIRARKRVKDDGTRVYEIWGPLFLVQCRILTVNSRIKEDPTNVEIDFIESRVSDHSGVEALSNLAHKYMEANKTVKLTHLSPECQTLLLKADPTLEAIIAKSIDDPRYYVVTDLVDQEV